MVVTLGIKVFTFDLDELYNRTDNVIDLDHDRFQGSLKNAGLVNDYTQRGEAFTVNDMEYATYVECRIQEPGQEDRDTICVLMGCYELGTFICDSEPHAIAFMGQLVDKQGNAIQDGTITLRFPASDYEPCVSMQGYSWDAKDDTFDYIEEGDSGKSSNT